MITSVRLINFKNFADETLKLGPFTVIVGANASGKSNIRDAFRFLHGIGRGYTLVEIICGKIGGGGRLEWEPIRGAPDSIVRIPDNGNIDIGKFSLVVNTEIEGQSASYVIDVQIDGSNKIGFNIEPENHVDQGETVFDNVEADDGLNVLRDDGVDTAVYEPLTRLKTEPAEARQPANGRREIDEFHALLGRMRFFDFKPELMKMPSVAGSKLGDYGENLPSSLQTICADEQREEIFASWLSELTPMDVTGFRFAPTLSGGINFEIVEQNGRRIAADSVSDGTLRFLGLLVVILGNEQPLLCFVEDVSKGIHPARLHLLADLIERQTQKRGCQLITTTHSPDLLSWLSEESFENVSVCCSNVETTDGVIRPMSSFPNIRELKTSQGLHTLHATGWFEDMAEYAETLALNQRA